jgi:hypothetical protein
MTMNMNAKTKHNDITNCNAHRQGEEWQKFRSKVNPAMMQPRNVGLYVGTIDGVADEFVSK